MGDGRGAQRMEAAAAFERTVRAELTQRGWRVGPFGIGELPPTTRAILHEPPPTPLRWLPDLLAFRHGIRLAVDAKNSDGAGGTHVVEGSALFAACQIEAWSGIAELFVFADGCVIDANTADRVARPGTYRGNGSGTAFSVIPCAACRKFDAVFGPVMEVRR